MEEIPMPYPTSSSPQIYVGLNSNDATIVHDNDNKIVLHNDNDGGDDPFDFPPGFRFCPFDEELIRCYLRRKVMNQILPLNKIHEVNLYEFSPHDLSKMYRTVGEKEWYFFTPRDRKYRNGTRPNRAAGNGFWKATGADKPIKDKNNVVVGFRKALVYYQGRPPKGVKTNWIMHEYRVREAPPPKSREGANDMRLDDWVLCRIYNKVDKSEKSRPKNESLKSAAAASPLPTHDEHLSVMPYDQQGMGNGIGIGIGIQNETQFPFLSDHEMQAFHLPPPPCMEHHELNNNVNEAFIGGATAPLYSDPDPVFTIKYDDPYDEEYMLCMDPYITDMDHMIISPKRNV